MDPQTQRPFPLAMATEDQHVRVVSLRAGHSLDRRLTELGINVGVDLCVVQRQGGSLVVARQGTRIAIGAGISMKVMVVAF